MKNAGIAGLLRAFFVAHHGRVCRSWQIVPQHRCLQSCAKSRKQKEKRERAAWSGPCFEIERIIADMPLASIAAMPVTSNRAIAAPSSAADAPEENFHSVLASYAPANDALAAQAKSAPAETSRAAHTVMPKEIEAIRHVRSIEGTGKTSKSSTKADRSAKDRRDTRPSQSEAAPHEAKHDAKVLVAAHSTVLATPQAVKPPVAIAAGTLTQQPVQANDDAADEPASETPSIEFDLTTAAKSETRSNASADPAGTRGQIARRDNPANMRQDNQPNAPKPQSGDAAQIKPVGPLPKQALDAVIAAAKAQTQQPALSVAPAVQTNPGNLAAMLKAVRGTISAMVTPKQAQPAKADVKPAPAALAVDKNVDAGEIQQGDADSSAQGDQHTAQDGSPDQIVAVSDKLSKSDIATPAPSAQTAQPASQIPANASPVVAGAAPNAANSSLSVPMNGADKPTQANTQPAIQPNLGALATAIVAKSAAGTKTFDIRMDPPELGRVDVHLSVDSDGKVQAMLSAEHPQTLEMLQRDSQTLERALKDSGLNLSNNSLNFSLKGEGRQGDGGGAFAARTRSLPDAVVARAEAANASVSNFNFASGNGRLDIRV